MTYAANTTVTVEKSRGEIERILQRYGCTKFVYGWEEQGAMIWFEAQGRRIKFVLPLPNPRDQRFTHYRRGEYGALQVRSETAAQAQFEQACRSRWRALALIIKAKLEAVESGIVTFEDEFLAHTMLPSGETFGEWASPQFDAIYSGGGMPALLPGSPTDTRRD